MVDCEVFASIRHYSRLFALFAFHDYSLLAIRVFETSAFPRYAVMEGSFTHARARACSQAKWILVYDENSTELRLVALLCFGSESHVHDFFLL